MVEMLYQIFIAVIGPDHIEQLTIGHMVGRTIIIYIFGIVLVLFDKRFIGLKTSFDVLLQITVGSIFANIITGNSAFFISMAAVIFLVLINWILAALSYYNKTLERWLKGSRLLLVDNGTIIWKNMRSNFISQEDLFEAIRMNANLLHLEDVEKAYLENDGEISVTPKKSL